jgi:hypothetical protein
MLIERVVSDALDPAVFLPAILLGWFVRNRWIVVAGAMAIALARLAASLTTPLPLNAERLWWVEPIGVVAPFLWAFAARGLRRWLQSRDRVAPRSVGPRLVRTLVGVIAGGVLLGGVAFLLGTLYVEAADVSTFEGNAGYLVMFLFLPPGIVTGAILGAVVAWRRSGRVNSV